MADWRITFYGDSLKRLFESEDGPVAKDLAKRAVRVESAAKRLAPVRSGRLRASITHQMARDERGLLAVIGTNVSYALYQELGTMYMSARPFLRPALREASRAR
jgi:HK97 gp10 family phage protein